MCRWCNPRYKRAAGLCRPLGQKPLNWRGFLFDWSVCRLHESGEISARIPDPNLPHRAYHFFDQRKIALNSKGEALAQCCDEFSDSNGTAAFLLLSRPDLELQDSKPIDMPENDAAVLHGGAGCTPNPISASNLGSNSSATSLGTARTPSNWQRASPAVIHLARVRALLPEVSHA